MTRAPVRRQPRGDRKCPCGSGKRFDGCCRSAYDADMAVWSVRRETEARLIRSVSDYVLRRWGPPFLASASKWFAPGPYRSDRTLAKLRSLFDVWFAFSFTAFGPPWDGPESDHWPDTPNGLAWMADHPSIVTDDEQRFLMTASDSPWSLLMIEDVTPGWSLRVRDLLTCRRFAIIDPEISTRARRDDILVSAILTLDGVSTLLGPAAFALPPDMRLGAIQMLEMENHGEPLGLADLRAVHLEVQLTLCDADDGQKRPVTIGLSFREPCKAYHMRWAIDAPIDEAARALGSLTLAGDRQSMRPIRAPDGITSIELPWFRPPRRPEYDCEWELFGALYLEDGVLTGDAPNLALARELMGEVETRLGPAARLTEFHTAPNLRRVHDREGYLPVVKMFPK